MNKTTSGKCVANIAVLTALLMLQPSYVNADQQSETDAGLLAAARQGDVAAIAHWLDAGANVNARNSKGNTALIECVSYAGSVKSSDAFRLLIKRGTDIEVENKDGETALMACLLEDDTKPAVKMDMLKALLEKGANLLHTDSGGDTPLAYAIRGNSPDKEHQSPLEIASLRGRTDQVRLYLDRSARVDVRRKGGETPLMLAANQDHKAIIQMLVEAGADVNALDDLGRSPLMWTLMYFADTHPVVQNADRGIPRRKESEEIVPIMEYLVRHGADINTKAKNGETPRSLARQMNATAEEWLADHGAARL